MQIKEITDKDICDVARTMASAYSEKPWHENWSPDKAERRVRAILHNYGSLGLMAQENQEVRVIQLMSIQDNVPFYEKNKMSKDSIYIMYKRID